MRHFQPRHRPYLTRFSERVPYKYLHKILLLVRLLSGIFSSSIQNVQFHLKIETTVSARSDFESSNHLSFNCQYSIVYRTCIMKSRGNNNSNSGKNSKIWKMTDK